MARLALVDALQHVHRLLHHLVLVRGGHVLAVVDRHGVQAAGDGQRRRAGVEGRELRRVQRGGGDDEAQLGALRQQLLAEPEQDVGVDAAVVRLVQHDHRVAAELGIGDELLHEATVRDVLDLSSGRRLVIEATRNEMKMVAPDRVAHLLSERTVHFLGNATSEVNRGHAARLANCDGSLL